MLITIIIRTKDEAPRLRLALVSLSRQTVSAVAAGTRCSPEEIAFETIVVNDGSQDATRDVLESAPLPVRAVHHPQALGRSAAANAGACVASGEVLLFLDGDNLVASDFVAAHARLHGGRPVMARGQTYNLRCTRIFQDPETGQTWPGQEAQLRRLGPDLVRHLVTQKQIVERFDQIHGRAELGVYPGAGPRQLAELELDALRNHPDLGVLWMAASGSNSSVRRQDFVAVGGFHERLTINEHRELALRLMNRGVRLVCAESARSYHLTHRTGWRDPLQETDWEEIMYSAHPCLAVKLMSIFWLSLAGVKTIPPEARILSLPQMDAVVRHGTNMDYDAIRRAHRHLAELVEKALDASGVLVQCDQSPSLRYGPCPRR